MPKNIEILSIEDSLADQKLIQEMFRCFTQPYRLSFVANGVEALHFLHQRDRFLQAPRPHLILLDLNLPGKDGREVLAEIKSDDSLRSIPVLILTTSNRVDDISLCYHRHANGVISKPSDVDRFTEVIRNIEQFWVMTAHLSAAI